jgi:hypothetical protein
MCRPAGARFAGDGIGYKYVAPLGLLDLVELNALPLSQLTQRKQHFLTKNAAFLCLLGF